MTAAPYKLTPTARPRLGLIVLQSDETIEQEFRRLIPADAQLNASRVPSATDVTEATLARMEEHIAAAAALLPRSGPFDAVGYACTSGASVIGPEKVDGLIRDGVAAGATTDPLRALVAACAALGIGRLAVLSPYVEAVSARLRAALSARGVETSAFLSFDEGEEEAVARIDGPSIIAAAADLAAGRPEAIFLSCTNLRTLDVIDRIEAACGAPVLSSNQVLAWHMQRLCSVTGPLNGPGRLMAAPLAP